MDIYDVMIAGGGTSGAIAAISAARAGLKTIVVERLSGLGGTQTFGMVTPIMNSNVPGGEFVNSAIADEIRKELIARGFCEWLWFDPVMMKVVLEEKVLESGAEILYDTSVIGLEANGKKIKDAIIFNSDGIGRLSAREYIDCTGDADLAKMSGVKVMSGNKEGINQSASLRFEMANVDYGKLSAYLKSTGQTVDVEEPMIQINTVDAFGSADFIQRAAKARDEGRLNDIEISHLQMFSVPGRMGVMNFNCPETGSGKGVSSAAERTRRLISGRKSILKIAAFMIKDIPGFENAYISEIAPLLGIRESERICAEYEYGIEDIVNHKRFEDAILKSAYPIDIHGASSEIGEEIVYAPCEPKEKYFEYPYRAMVPKGIKNLLVCGRCSGCDFYSQSALRVQFSCQAMGEAAGIAAKLVLEHGGSFAEVDGRQVRAEMQKRGSMLFCSED